MTASTSMPFISPSGWARFAIEHPAFALIVVYCAAIVYRCVRVGSNSEQLDDFRQPVAVIPTAAVFAY